jgi:uncharacterized protein YbcI
MMSEETTPSRTEIEAAIADELLRVQLESYGAGASSIDVQVGPDSVLAVIDVELTPAERTLLSAGEADAVKLSREAFQEAIAPTFEAIVERATGRQVSSFLSAMNIDPLYSVEFFRLAPAQRLS